MTIPELNSLDRPAFVDAVGSVFEQSPWVANRAWLARPFADVDALHAAMKTEVERATFAEKLALLKAHPDLGSRAKLAKASAEEQAGAGLNNLSPGELDRLGRLNSAYRSRFGFPFLLAVRGSSMADILRQLQARLNSPPEDEFREALSQVYRIARFRLETLVA